MIRLEEKILKKFIKHQQTLSLAESCTGGLIGHHLTNVPGASTYFLLGIVAYDYAAKTKLLGVPPKTLLIGIAGPGGATAHKKVGLVYIALASQEKTIVQQCQFKGSRLAIKKQTCQTALKMLAH